MTGDGATLILHATAVAVAGRGLLILGASGAGKSSLALQMMAFGAGLIADDRVCLHQMAGKLVATAPERLSGLIEARGIGLLQAQALGPTHLHLAVDLDRAEPDRLPAARHITLLACRIPLVLGRDAPHLAYGLMQYLRGGRSA